MATSQRPKFVVDLSLTEEALTQVKGFLDQEDLPAKAGLRVSVLPGGCSGFKYGLNIEEQALEDDMIIDHEGVRIFVDAFSAQYLNGTTINYVETLQGSGFAFENPKATGGCGCGSSFSA